MSIAVYASQTLNIYITKHDLDELLEGGEIWLDCKIGWMLTRTGQVHVTLDDGLTETIQIALTEERAAFRALKPKPKPKVSLVKLIVDEQGGLYAPPTR